VLPGGKIYEGVNGLALEVGHISVPFREDDGELPPCSCGLKGCSEAWVSLMALRRRLKLDLAKPQWPAIRSIKWMAPWRKRHSACANYAEQGDELAVSLFKQQGFILGFMTADLVRVFDPGLVVFGGGLAETSFRDQYMEWIQEDSSTAHGRHTATARWDHSKISTHFEWAMGW